MSSSALVRQLKKSSVFAEVSDDAVAALCEHARVDHHAPGDRLLRENDPSEHVFVLLEGLVGVFYSSPSGADVIVKVFGPPAVFGEMELFFAQPRMEYVEVFEQARAAKIDGDAFIAFLKQHDAASFQMVRDLSARLCIAAYNERSLAFHDVSMRVAHLFLTFLEAYSEPTDDGPRLRLKLTYETIARCLGVTEKSIERTIGKWTKAGWLTRSRGHYTFVDLDKLEAHADPERLVLFSRLGLSPHR